MKRLKKILLSTLVILSLAIYFGQDIADAVNHIMIEINFTCNATESQASSESPFEEDVPSIIPLNSSAFTNPGCQRIITLYFSQPLKGYHSIWLPPEIS